MATRIPAPRYSIGEWFGQPMDTLTPEARVEFAAKAQMRAEDAQVKCPFRSEFFGKDMACNKAGGVCTISQYSKDADGNVSVAAEGACVCPIRLLDTAAFKHVGKAVLGSDKTWVVREVPFLQNAVQNEQGRSAKAGRIDFVLVADDDRTNWCAVETQAVYFSGNNMGVEFDAIAEAAGALIYPVGQRRPDYRSSVPKRLSPQLMLKAPHLGRGKQIAVVVDKFVQRQMAALVEPHVDSAGMSPEEHRLEKLALSEVVWFFVALPSGAQATVAGEAYTTLASSIRALDSALPIPANRFSAGLGALITDPAQRGEKVLQLFD